MWTLGWILMQKRYFTLEEAQGILPQVSSKVDNVVRINEGLQILLAAEKAFEEDIHIEFDDPAIMHFQSNTKLNKNIHKLYYEFYKELEELEKLGCVVKSMDPVLVDFLVSRDGKDVFLCWKEGEEKLEFWHDIDDGFEGRKPISIKKTTNEN